ncbi:MAG TPA: hypothetical protein VGM60_03195 [Pseudonocardia sp.]|uniref:hypothetical protein n=1 Tax=Pseudonocardia sp. TaxID=60912 RepID=UPI002F3E88E3
MFSYVFRLAEANDLDRPTILLRALGEPTTGPSRFMVDEFDLMLNQHALHRLGTLSGIAADQLLWSLPSLHRLLPSGPDGPPVIRRYRCHSLRKHCETCLSRMPGRPKIIIRPMAFPKICAKHRRWIDTRDKEDQFQIDLAGAPEVITAHRRYARLRHKVGVGEQAWLREQLRAVTLIAREWVWKIRWDREELHQRWEARSAAIRPWPSAVTPNDLLVFPEAIALAEVICDLEWRRHVAMAQHDIDLKPFYHRVAARLGQPPQFAALARCSGTDPLRTWVQRHRATHEQIRAKHWDTAWRNRHTPPLPEIRNFK